jgi:hypothetical protein
MHKSNLTSDFKNSLAADLYSPQEIVDFSSISMAFDSYAIEVEKLESILKDDIFGVVTLSDAILSFPRIYSFICLLLSISNSIELEDGRILPSPLFPPKSAASALEASVILSELGIEEILSPPINFRALFILAQISTDAPRRRLRVDAKIKARVLRTIQSAIEKINNERSVKLSLVTTSSLPQSAKRIVEYVIAVDGIARVGVAVTFQTYSGGRQTRDLTTVFPSVKKTLSAARIGFILIADGQGMRGIPERVLSELFVDIPHTMSLSQAEHEGLYNAMDRILDNPEEQPANLAGLEALIDNSLARNAEVDASTLPIASDIARLALANYLIKNKHLDLVVAAEGQSVSWRRSGLVDAFRKLAKEFHGPDLLSSTIALLEGEKIDGETGLVGYATSLISLGVDPIFASTMLIVARDDGPTASCLRDVSRYALQTVPASRLAIFVTSIPLSSSAQQEIKDVQASLPITIVTIDIATCLSMAKNRESVRDRLRSLLLEQTDLTKLSPFVVRGVTPPRVFFGREEEEADLLSTLATNSVALLGGRRIGKTSLMRHSSRRLQSANLEPYFGDCQVVRTWADFGKMASRNWDVDVPENFKPQDLFKLVQELGSRNNKAIVILLDEVDQLLDWDKRHGEDDVPEAFFRACRSISQQGLAQFVFSGERTIAFSLWDAKSPHWNFCKPLMLRQLTRTAADALLAEPLENLGIKIEKKPDFLTACWTNTDGHPELLQLIGDKLVSLVNQRSRLEILVTTEDVQELTEQFDYAEQYLETYWGQAEPLERIVSILLIRSFQTLGDLLDELNGFEIVVDGKKLHEALRMLELYGIAEQSALGYTLRASWFPTALSYYGGLDLAIRRYIGEFNK